jgi:hypothetical protein
LRTVGYRGADVPMAVDAPPSETIDSMRCLRVSRTFPSRATKGIARVGQPPLLADMSDDHTDESKLVHHALSALAVAPESVAVS